MSSITVISLSIAKCLFFAEEKDFTGESQIKENEGKILKFTHTWQGLYSALMTLGAYLVIGFEESALLITFEYKLGNIQKLGVFLKNDWCDGHRTHSVIEVIFF